MLKKICLRSVKWQNQSELQEKIILNYEAKGLITPDFKDGKNGNRYYTVDTFTKNSYSTYFAKARSVA